MNKIKILLSVLFVVGLAFAIQPANSWTVGAQGKYVPSGAQANVTTEGGNVTPLNFTGSNVSTEKWAGYWGNITGSNIILSPGTSIFYSWVWSSVNGGEVCAVAAPSGFNWVGVQPITAAAIDLIWNFGAQTDNATSTFTTACNVDIGGIPVASVGVLTGVGGFETCAVGDGGATKSDVAFCVNITQNGNLFNGLTGDYELMAPTNKTAGTTETHYFWLELD